MTRRPGAVPTLFVRAPGLELFRAGKECCSKHIHCELLQIIQKYFLSLYITDPEKEKPFRTFQLKRIDDSSRVIEKVEVIFASYFNE